MRRSRLLLALLLGLALDRSAKAGPADALLKLVPTDTSVTLAVEDLRDRSRELVGSPLFERILRLPSVRTWRASERFRRFQQSFLGVLAALEVSPEALRDDILGDAVILTLQAGPPGRPEQAKGLLLIKARDLPLIERLIRALNDAQFREGELAGVEDRLKGTVKYSTRLFKAAGRAPEFYVLLDDSSFAWSNSEALILGVIDRKVATRPNLGDDPGSRKVRTGLPVRALASLYVNPRFLERAMADAARPAVDRPAAMIARYLGAVEQVGFAIESRDGLKLHSSETLDPGKLDPWLKDWLTRPPSPISLPALASPTTVAVLSANLDFRALADAIGELVPEEDRPALENLKLAFRGLLMGRDPMTEVLPRLGPGTLLTIEVEPDKAIRPLLPLVGAVGWSNPPGAVDLSGPIDNAIRTFLAFHAFDASRRMDHLRVESRSIGDARLTVLTDGARTILAYRVERDRVILGNSPEAVARFGAGQAPSMISKVRARSFPEAETFAIVDLDRLVREVRALRGPFARALAARSKRPVDAANRDLGDLIAVAELFQAATFHSTTARDASEIRRTIGLHAR